jgi:hypothetical protein
MFSAARPFLARHRGPFLALLAAGAALGVSGCASDGPTHPTLPDRPTVERPDGITPDGVAEMRETISDRRSASRDLMDTTLVTPSTLDTNEAGPDFLGYLGTLTGYALDALSLQTFGIW